MNWYLEVLKKYAVFNGRARRKEYWMFVLFNLIIAFVLALIGGIVQIASQGAVTNAMLASGCNSFLSCLFAMPIYAAISVLLAPLYNLAVLIPGIAVSVRRLHDTNHSGWWLFIALVPLIGAIVLLVFMVQDSQAGENQYGPNPKAASV